YLVLIHAVPVAPEGNVLGTGWTRSVDRLRALPESRLAAPAATAFVLAQLLVDIASGIEQRDHERFSRRPLPDLGMFVVADQLEVAGADLEAAAEGLEPSTEVWTPDGARATLGAVLARAQAAGAEA